MGANTRNIYGVSLALAIICTLFLLYAMVAIPIFREQVFLERGTISAGGEMSILVAFLFALLFNIVSILWMWSRVRTSQLANKGDQGIMALGVLSLVLSVGEKMLVDEISREYSLAPEALGEWILLYVGLAIQFCYNVVIVRILSSAYRVR